MFHARIIGCQIPLLPQTPPNPNITSPKGGGGIPAGWVQDKELTREEAQMTYTFKISRRLARLRDASLVVAVVFTISCTSDEATGPEAGPASDPIGISVAPGSVLLSPNQGVQFMASTVESGAFSTSLRKGRGRGWRSVVGLRVAPETLTVAGGSAANFVATASLSDGSSAEPSVTWSATGGTIDANGKYTAGPSREPMRLVPRLRMGSPTRRRLSSLRVPPSCR